MDASKDTIEMTEGVVSSTREYREKKTVFETKHGCPVCPYTSGRRNNVDRHITSMHDPTNRTLICCEQSFVTKAALQEHVRSAHSTNGYICPECGRSFGRRALLLRHSSIHTGVKTFQCTSCKYATSHKTNLARHCRAHNHSPPTTLALQRRRKNGTLSKKRPCSGDEGSPYQSSSPELADTKKPVASGNADGTAPKPPLWQPWTTEEPLDLRRRTYTPKAQGFQHVDWSRLSSPPQANVDHLDASRMPMPNYKPPVLVTPRPYAIVGARIVNLLNGQQVMVYEYV